MYMYTCIHTCIHMCVCVCVFFCVLLLSVLLLLFIMMISLYLIHAAAAAAAAENLKENKYSMYITPPLSCSCTRPRHSAWFPSHSRSQIYPRRIVRTSASTLAHLKVFADVEDAVRHFLVRRVCCYV